MNTKILVISDTHKETLLAHKIIQADDYDYIFHLGDSYDDMLELRSCYGKKVYGVTGNVDFVSEGPGHHSIVIKGKRILLTHGHHYKVKHNLDLLRHYGQEMGYDLVMFGHTHNPYLEEESIVLFNPGSLSKPQSDYPSYGIIEISDKIKCYHNFVK